jgi:hypothetical protein
MVGTILLMIAGSFVIALIGTLLFVVGLNVIKNGDYWWQKLIGIIIIVIDILAILGLILKMIGI